MTAKAPTYAPAAMDVATSELVECTRDERTEHRLLGRALRVRSADIVRLCQLKYAAQNPDVTFESVSKSPLWAIASNAATAIADWLITGSSTPNSSRSHTASLGDAVATYQETEIADRDSRLSAPFPTVSDDGKVSRGVLSVALLTKINLWWKDATCQVLAEEVGRLGISERTYFAAIKMVDRSCNSSMVTMGKQYDRGLQDLQARLIQLANHDQLTGLANRTVFLRRLEDAIARTDGRQGLAVVFIDLDNFKSINDGLGHGGGDELLKVVGVRFTDLMRPEDTIARFGGDEFVALFEDLAEPAVEGAALAARLHQAIAEPIVIADKSQFVTASIGVAVVTSSDFSSEDVLAQADSAMYRVKRSGRNHVDVVEMIHEPLSAVVVEMSEPRGGLARCQAQLCL
jgi:diguanylate cyclase (GGDEF)-like protein